MLIGVIQPTALILDIDSASHSEIKTACMYEDMCELQRLREALKREDELRTLAAPYGLSVSACGMWLRCIQRSAWKTTTSGVF